MSKRSDSQEVRADEPALPRLPPGRHGLSREFVTNNQRERLAAGIIASVAEHGFHETTITQIAAAAGVSRRTFYAYFKSKEACYFDTYNLIAHHLREATRNAETGEDDWAGKVRARLKATLEFFAANADLARFVLIAPPRAGEGVLARYQQAIRGAATELTADPPADVDAPSVTVQESMVGGMATVIVRQVEAGKGESLPDLLPDLLELTLAPFSGRDAARRS